MTEEPFNRLTPEQSELLALLAEECAEVIQVVAKILRHGLASFHPADPSGTPNITLLQREVADVVAAIALLTEIGVFLADDKKFEQLVDFKLTRVLQYLHHYKPRKPRV